MYGCSTYMYEFKIHFSVSKYWLRCVMHQARLLFIMLLMFFFGSVFLCVVRIECFTFIFGLWVCVCLCVFVEYIYVRVFLSSSLLLFFLFFELLHSSEIRNRLFFFMSSLHRDAVSIVHRISIWKRCVYVFPI